MKTALSLARALCRDAWRKLWRPIVPTLVLAGVIAGASVALFATSGLALASQQRTLDRLNAPEGRLITITDPRGNARLDARSIDMLATLTGVEWVVGAGPARTVSAHAIPGGETVTARMVYGPLPPAIVGLGDRTLLPGQAVASEQVADRIGLADGVGHVQGGGVAADIVAPVWAHSPLNSWNDEVLISADGEGMVLSIYVSVADLQQLPAVREVIRGSLVALRPGEAVIETSDDLTALSGDVIDELVATSQQTVASLLGIVAILVAAVQFGRVSSMAKEIGRRRALGASRSLIVASVLLSAGLAATLGAMVGTAAGMAVTLAATGALPRLEFIVSIPVLLVLTSLIGAALPAVRASRLDPVAILRVP